MLTLHYVIGIEIESQRSEIKDAFRYRYRSFFYHIQPTQPMECDVNERSNLLSRHVNADTDTKDDHCRGSFRTTVSD